jgi:hypothetical protein
MKMKCPNPNCDATDHEPGAKYCQKCGTELKNVSTFSRHAGRETSPKSNGRKTEIPKVKGSPIRERESPVQDNTDWPELGSGVSSLQKIRWGNPARYVLLLAILAEYIIISIKESSITDADGVHGYAVTTIFANIFIFICTLAICVFANMGHFEDEKLALRIYYEWLHFLTAALMPILGLGIVSNMQNGWTLLLDGILVVVVLLVDFVLPDLID